MQYPNLNNEDIIAFDIETYDPLLIKEGPGVYRRDGNILGVAIATGSGYKAYYDFAHKGITVEDKERNKKYIRDVLGNNVPKVAANILYDLDWLENWADIPVNGKLNDVQIAEPLLDEYKKHYDLDTLSQQYLGYGKQVDGVQQWCDDKGLTGKAVTHLYMVPYDIVAKYAEMDADNCIGILAAQKEELKSQDLLDLYDLECRLIRLLLQMRKVGVRIDMEAVEQNIDFLTGYIKEEKLKLFAEHGEFNLNSSNQKAVVLDALGIPYPTTTKGNPNIDAIFLETIDHPIGQQIIDIKRALKARNDFLVNALQRKAINGRVHCQFIPLKTDDNGTKSGRMAAMNPNLQQIPSRIPLYNKLLRSCFIPEEYMTWGKWDWSQIEYRFIAHYAIGPGSKEVRQVYNDNPNTDYHEMVMGLSGLDRKPAKNLNFGAAYFMGVKTCAKKNGWTETEAAELLQLYFRKVPFVKPTREDVVEKAKGRGYLRTILKRRARLSDVMRETGKEYSMFNRLIQGSAADLMKKSMVDAYEAGIFEVLPPHLTVHDELDTSIPRTVEGRDAALELKHIMETSIKLDVPVIADMEVGENWYSLEDYTEGCIV